MTSIQTRLVPTHIEELDGTQNQKLNKKQTNKKTKIKKRGKKEDAVSRPLFGLGLNNGK